MEDAMNKEIDEKELKKLELEKQILSYLGLARRGRNAVSGEFSVEKAVKSYEARLVLVAEDASDNTKKKFSDMCAFYKVPFYTFGIKDDLGHAIGTEFRASVTVNNAGMAKKIIELLENR